MGLLPVIWFVLNCNIVMVNTDLDFQSELPLGGVNFACLTENWCIPFSNEWTVFVTSFYFSPHFLSFFPSIPSSLSFYFSEDSGLLKCTKIFISFWKNIWELSLLLNNSLLLHDKLYLWIWEAQRKKNICHTLPTLNLTGGW